MRYLGVIISSFLGGISRAIDPQSISVNFSVTTIAGSGFIAFAAMIFGKWNPTYAMHSSIYFRNSKSLDNIVTHCQLLQGMPED